MESLAKRKADRKARAKENAELAGVDVPAEALGADEGKPSAKPAAKGPDWKPNA